MVIYIIHNTKQTKILRDDCTLSLGDLNGLDVRSSVSSVQEIQRRSPPSNLEGYLTWFQKISA